MRLKSSKHTVTLHRSHCQWPIHWYRLMDGWMLRVFWLTIIVGRECHPSPAKTQETPETD